MAAEQDAEARRIGQLIAGLRQGKGWSQEDLAREVGVGVSTVSRWERGRHEGYLRNVRKLAKALEVTPGVLRPVPPDTESQLDRIERKLDQVLGLLGADQLSPEEEADEVLAEVEASAPPDAGRQDRRDTPR